MTRKDYVMLALTLRLDAAHLRLPTYSYPSMSEWEKGAYDQWNTTVLAIADALKEDNKAFDKPRFLKACGVS